MPTYDQALMSPGMANYAGLRSSGKRRQTKPRAPATAPAMPTFGDLRAAYRPYLDRLSRRMGRMAMPDLRELGAAYGPYLQPKTPPHGQQPFGYLGSAAAQSYAQPDPITAQPYGALPGKAPRLPAVPDYMQPPLATPFATAPLGITDAARAATSAQDLAGPSMFTPADMPASMPENIPQRRSAMQDWMGQRNRLQAFLAAGGSQGIPEGAGGMYGTPTHGGRGYATGDPRLGRTMPAAFSTYEGGFGAEKSWQPNLGSLPGDEGAMQRAEEARQLQAQQSRTAGILGRAPTAFTATASPGDPTAWEDFKERQGMTLADAQAGRETATEAWAGPSDLAEWGKHRRYIEAQAAGDLSVKPSTRYTAGDKGKRTVAKQKRSLELEKRKIRLAGKKGGAPVPEWLAKIQAKNQLGVALTPTDEKALEVRRQRQMVQQLGPEAAGGLLQEQAKTKGLADIAQQERDWQARPEIHRQAMEQAAAQQGQVLPAPFVPPEPGTPLEGLSEGDFQTLKEMTDTQKVIFLRDQKGWDNEKINKALPGLTGKEDSTVENLGGSWIKDFLSGVQTSPEGKLYTGGMKGLLKGALRYGAPEMALPPGFRESAGFARRYLLNR